MKTYLGLDLSTKTGAVVLDHMGEVLYAEEWDSSAKLSDYERADIQANHLLDVLDQYTPTHIVIEDYIRHWVNPNVAIKLIGMGHILRYFLWSQDIEFNLVAPTQLKKFVTGKGNVKKDVIRLEAYKKWDYEHKSDNVVDAYCLAQMGRYKSLPAGNKEQQKIIDAVFSCN